MAIEYMRPRIKENKPFFLMVAPHPPHGPWTPAQTPAGSLDRVAKKMTWRKNVPKPGEREDQIRCYYAMIANIDDNIGRLMSFLEESGGARDTIVVFSSDHGNMLGSRGLYTKLLPYEESVDIPLLMRWPGHIREGSQSDALFTPMDCYPTLAGLCGLKAPAIVNGMDLSGAVLGRGGSPRDAALMALYSSHFAYPETGTIFPEWRAVRTRQHSYIRWLTGKEELYDLSEDRLQMRNLMDGGAAPAAATALRERMAALLRESHDDFGPGAGYTSWLTPERRLVRNALGPLKEPA
jgi:arylsulfatase A-like enzyme